MDQLCSIVSGGSALVLPGTDIWVVSDFSRITDTAIILSLFIISPLSVPVGFSVGQSPGVAKAASWAQTFPRLADLARLPSEMP